jgi:GLPGLI family protein
MKNKLYYITAALLFFCSTIHAQQFIDKAVIEYEVKTNIKKTMSNDSWGEMLKENMPEFQTSYYNFTFADNKSIYQFSKWDEKMPQFIKQRTPENIWYYDFEAAKYTVQKDIAGSKFVIADSIANINWKITNESRQIAGFNCRKAVGIIMDSVYVFAFYTDEIIIPGGPVSVNGLPGMIMGLTIPRLYTSFVATKVSLSGVNGTAIKPVTAKKPYTNSSFKSYMTDKSKDWYSWGDDEEEKKRLKNLELWSIYL